MWATIGRTLFQTGKNSTISFLTVPDQGSLPRCTFQLWGSRVGLWKMRYWFASDRQSSLLLCCVLLHPQGYSPVTGKSHCSFLLSALRDHVPGSVPWPLELSWERGKHCHKSPCECGQTAPEGQRSSEGYKQPLTAALFLPGHGSDAVPQPGEHILEGNHCTGCPRLAQGQQGPWLSQHGQPSSD